MTKTSPALSPLISVLNRAATLIEKGTPPGKALRQVSRELEEYAQAHANDMIPPWSFDDQLGLPQRKVA